MNLYRYGSFLCLALALFGGRVSNASEAPVDWNKSIDRLVDSLPGFFGPQTIPTEPLPIKRVIPEWDPVEVLGLSIPLKGCLEDDAIFDYYSELIQAAANYVDILVLHRPKDEVFVDLFIRRLNESGLSAQMTDRIRFLRCQTGDFWVRDYSPIFGEGIDNDLVLIDNSVRPIIDEKEAWANTSMSVESFELGPNASEFEIFNARNRQRESTPAFIAKFIRQRYQRQCDVVRPPMHLQGGDYMTDGLGRVFISEDTILGNDGRLDYVRKVFRDYYGASEVHVLNALPGITVKHLDQIVKIVAPDTFLIAEALGESEFPNRSSTRRVSKEVRETLEANEAYLRKHFPQAKILKVPMLSPYPVGDEDVKYEVRTRVFAKLCEKIGVNYDKYHKLDNDDPQKEIVKRRVLSHYAKLHEKEYDFYDDSDLSWLALSYLGVDLETLIDTNVPSSTAHRTYINSTFINTREGKKAWLLPRYAPLGSESAQYILDIESKVEAVYRAAVPGSEVHWISSDVMARMLGAVHCSTFTVPAALASD